MKKIIAIAFAVVCALSTFGEIEKIDGVRYDYDVYDGKATIGSFVFPTTAIPTTTTGALIIPSTIGGYPVTRIGRRAFERCRLLTKVTIPEGVTEIDNYAFHDCESLTEVTIPASVKEIGHGAFSGCEALTSVTIPEGVVRIWGEAFDRCSSLKSVTIPGSVKVICSDSFYVKEVHISDLAKWCGISFLPSSSFYSSPSNPYFEAKHLYLDGKEIFDLVIPEGVTKIGNYAFTKVCSLKSVTIPDGVTTIGKSAFCECDSLKAVTIPNSVTEIGTNAFYKCRSLTEVTIPEGVRIINEDAFRDCESLTSVTIPDSVTTIGPHSFCCCYALRSVSLPAGLDLNRAFGSCTNLEEVVFRGGDEARLSDIKWCRSEFSNSKFLVTCEERNRARELSRAAWVMAGVVGLIILASVLVWYSNYREARAMGYHSISEMNVAKAAAVLEAARAAEEREKARAAAEREKAAEEERQKNVEEKNPWEREGAEKTGWLSCSGRARRSEYWSTILTITMMEIGLLVPAFFFPISFCGSFQGFQIGILIGVPIVLIAFIFAIPVTIRRLHDRGISGQWLIWYFFLGLVPIIGSIVGMWAFVELGCLEGDRGKNEYGPDPKAGE